MSDIAIIGTGISGLGAAYLLHPHHAITLYEKNDYVGGHTRTRVVRHTGRDIAVDTGFIVFNHRNYPNLTALFRHLDVPTQKSVMSFGVTAPDDHLEWGAENLGALFGQRRNLWRPAFYRFLLDILKFNRRARPMVARYPHIDMRSLLEKLNLGAWFARFYILPMGGAIWSLPLDAILAFPAKTFVDFFDAHGLLTVMDQPQWRTVTGGSHEYVRRLTASFQDRIRVNCGAKVVTRRNGKVQISDSQGEEKEYDRVILACHADEALRLLADPTVEEKATLGAFHYQKNVAVLHGFSGLMPKRRACWASWVYHATRHQGSAPIAVTYWMNHLQNLDKSRPLFVTLNPTSHIPDADVFERHEFTHPIYDESAVAAQSELTRLQGLNNSWFCGAYQRSGFHEDGLVSAITVAADMGVKPPWQ